MIFFVAPVDGTAGLGEYLQQYGTAIIGRVRILTYDEIALHRELALGTYVFSALDQLCPAEREIIAQCWKELARASSKITLINHPLEVLSRYQLLETFFQLKRNSFRAYRASKFASCRKFPVFLRLECEHTGSLTRLLHTRRELAQALAKTLLQGYRLRDLLVVEYCDTADSSGVFRKYSAFVVGDRIIPNSLVHNHDWITKWDGRLLDANSVREEFEYMENNPHRGWLKETFETAKVRYGRIDYGVRDSVPQVWEINTNPTIVGHGADLDPMIEERRKLLAPGRRRFRRELQEALEAIDSPEDSHRAVRIEVSRRQIQQLEAEKRLRSRVQARKTATARAAFLPIWLYHYLRTN